MFIIRFQCLFKKTFKQRRTSAERAEKMDVENTTARMYSIVIDKIGDKGTPFRVDLKPGKNEVPEKDWQKVKDHKYTNLLRRAGIISFEGATESKPKKSKTKKRGGKIEGL